jgi:hypothetical protein
MSRKPSRRQRRERAAKDARHAIAVPQDRDESAGVSRVALARQQKRDEGAIPRLVPRNPLQTRAFRHLYRGMRQPMEAMALNDRILRAMGHHPFVRMIIEHRRTQAQAFCQVPKGRGQVGFDIVPADENDPLTPEDEERKQEIVDLLINGGNRWPRPVDGKRGPWASDGHTPALPMSQWVPCIVDDELTAGNAGIIREAGRDRRRWPVTHFRPVDGFAIRIADFSEYKPEYRDDVKVIEYVILDENERPEYELAWSEFAHWVRKPVILRGRPVGYGASPLEECVDTLAGLAMAYNFNKGQFSENKLPQGILEVPEIDDEKMDEFLTTLELNIGGPAGNWSSVPIIARDAESQSPTVQWIPLGERPGDMVWERFLIMTFAQICAIYGASPEEVGFPSFSARQSALQEADPETRILHGEDKGFVPMMLSLQDFINREIVELFDGGRWRLEWQGLGKGNAEQEQNLRNLRLQSGYTSLEEERTWGDLPMRRYPLDSALWGKCQTAILKRNIKLLDDPDQLYASTEEVYARVGGAFSLATQVPLSPSLQQMWGQEQMAAQEDAGGMGGMEQMMGMGGAMGAGTPPPGAEAEGAGNGGAAAPPPPGMMQLPLPGVGEEAAQKSLKANARDIEVRFIHD